MHVHWLADHDHGGTETTVFNVTAFPPNRWHELHRHPGAEEYFFIIEGSGLHLTEKETVPLQAGDLVFVPKDEWHGFANDSDRPTVVISVFGGVLAYEDGGYDVHPRSQAGEACA
jgi:quercetin dioxygenase-like cupin family protein